MSRYTRLLPVLVLAARLAAAEDAPAEPKKDEPPKKDEKELSGMSILGNQEAPKALVIVPWKSSELGAVLGIAPLLDDAKAPVDREVFLRSLHYYEIRSESARPVGAPRSKS